MKKDIEEQNCLYTFEQVNCIERPIEVACECYGKYIGMMFLLYLKLKHCYRLVQYRGEIEKDYSMIQEIEEVLKRSLGLNLLRVKSLKLIETIEKLIDEQKFVFVFGNLRALYYSEHYMKNDWMHLFLITKYSSERSLFYIMDSTQFRENDVQNYQEFVIPYQIMCDMYSINNNKDILFMDCVQADIEDNPYKFLKEFLKEFLFQKEEQPYVESDIVKKIINKEQSIEFSKILLKCYHEKEVLFYELGKLLLACGVERNYYEKYRNSIQVLLHTNKAVCHKIVYLLYKNSVCNIEFLLQDLLEKEKNTENVLKEIFVEVNHEHNEVNTINKWIMENNRDDIITTCENEEVHFRFCGEKTYNYWQQDKAPKMIFYKVNDSDICFSFHVKLELKEYELGDKFFAGIFIRTDNSSFYIWGSNCGLSLLFEKTGVDPNIYEKFDSEKTVYLKFNYREEKLLLAYSINGVVYKQEHTAFSLDGKPLEIGIICKTWEKSNRLHFIFSEIKVNSEGLEN